MVLPMKTTGDLLPYAIALHIITPTVWWICLSVSNCGSRLSPRRLLTPGHHSYLNKNEIHQWRLRYSIVGPIELSLCTIPICFDDAQVWGTTPNEDDKKKGRRYIVRIPITLPCSSNHQFPIARVVEKLSQSQNSQGASWFSVVILRRPVPDNILKWCIQICQSSDNFSDKPASRKPTVRPLLKSLSWGMWPSRRTRGISCLTKTLFNTFSKFKKSNFSM
jgi:hypothetical protein